MLEGSSTLMKAAHCRSCFLLQDSPVDDPSRCFRLSTAWTRALLSSASLWHLSGSAREKERELLRGARLGHTSSGGAAAPPSLWTLETTLVCVQLLGRCYRLIFESTRVLCVSARARACARPLAFIQLPVHVPQGLSMYGCRRKQRRAQVPL